MATPQIDSYHESVLGLNIPIEEKARHIGDTPALLEERLRDALSCYAREYRALFSGARFVENRLVSRDGRWVLCWRLRRYPDAPVAYENQQTSMGYVELMSEGDYTTPLGRWK